MDTAPRICIKLYVAFLLVAGVVTAAAKSQESQDVLPVSPDLLHGATLAVDDFKLKAPDEAWRWLRLVTADKAASEVHPELATTNYVLVAPDGKTSFLFAVIASGPPGPPNETFMAGLQNGFERTHRKSGWTIDDFVFEPADIPVKGASYRFRCKATRSDGLVKYRFGYIGGIEKKYQFQYSDVIATESQAFTHFVESFSLRTDPTAN